MTAKLKTLLSLYRSMGIKWITYRAAYSFSFRTGLIKKKVPAYTWDKYQLSDRLKAEIPAQANSYAEWKYNNLNSRLSLRAIRYPEDVTWKQNIPVEEAQRIFDGGVKYFSHQFKYIGNPPDWLQDPFTDTHYENSKHWSEIPDYGPSDIKFVWEVNRFGWVYTLVRAYAANPDERYPQLFWKYLSDWMEKNPPGFGPNWKDGQEISLRLMAACFGYMSFFNASSTVAGSISQFALFAAAHAQRILQNVDFAVSTKSNHTISEGFGLWLAGIIFPEFHESKKYLKVGRKILEDQIREQFLDDGGYAMYSLNYQRFSLQIYLIAIRLADRLGQPFSDQMRQRFTRSIEMLASLADDTSGQIPFFGSNDGALILPLNNCEFSDFRPIIQAGYYLANGKRFYTPGPWDEDLFWIFGSDAIHAEKIEHPIVTDYSYPNAGIYKIHSDNSFAVVRCVDFKARPSHADQLHMDFWWHGQNIASDAGTYLYHGEKFWQNRLSGTDVHNTVTVDHQDQMKRLSRITWGDWAKGKASFVQDHSGNKIWVGKHDGYHRLKDPVDHTRKVISLGKDRWLILDHLTGNDNHHYRIQWLFTDYPYQLLENNSGIILEAEKSTCKILVGSTHPLNEFTLQKADPESSRGWISRFYAQKEPAISLALVVEQRKTTFWTFFGYQEDSVKMNNQQIEVRFENKSRSFNLVDYPE